MNWVSLTASGEREHISETQLDDNEKLNFTTLCGKKGYSKPGAELTTWYQRFDNNPPWGDYDCQECKRIYLLIKNL